MFAYLVLVFLIVIVYFLINIYSKVKELTSHNSDKNIDTILISLRDLNILNNEELEKIIQDNNKKNVHDQYYNLLSQMKNKGVISEGFYNDKLELLKKVTHE